MKQFQPMKKAKGGQQGFTLIELVVVIVIAGILGSALVATYVDLSGEAKQANFDQSVASINSAIALDIAKNDGTNVDGTSDAAGLITALKGANLLQGDVTATGNDITVDGTSFAVQTSTCNTPNGGSGICSLVAS